MNRLAMSFLPIVRVTAWRVPPTGRPAHCSPERGELAIAVAGALLEELGISATHERDKE
jgi:hypothetical protein